MSSRGGFLACWVAAGSLAAACGGGQTGDLGGADEDSLDGNCVETESELPLDAKSSLGFSAAEVLNWVEGTRATSLAWGVTGDVEFLPNDSLTEVSFELECPEPTPRYVAAEPKQPERSSGDETDDEADDECPDRLRVNCELRVATADGGLDENWAVSVDATRSELASIRHRLEPDEFQGSFAIGAPKQAGAQVKQLTLQLALSRFGVAGGLSSVLERRTDSGVSATGVSYAIWPAEACGDLGDQVFAVEASPDTGDVSSESILGQLLPDAERAVEWPDGQQTTLSLQVSSEPTGCVAFEPNDQGFSAVYSTTLSASTDDGRLMLAADASLRAGFDGDGAITEAVLSASQAPSAEQLQRLLALSAEQVEELINQYDSLELELVQALERGTSSGVLRLFGSVVPECISNPSERGSGEDTAGGTPGCSGVDQVLVFETIWTP